MDYGAIGMLKQVDKSVLNLVGHRVLKVFNTEVTKSELYFRGNKRAIVYTGRTKKRSPLSLSDSPLQKVDAQFK